jgi:hypothetical protein
MTRTRQTKGSTSSKSSAFARLGKARARKGYAKTEPCFCANGNKIAETRNKMPAASVYLLENLHFLPFFVADSVRKCVNISKGDKSLFVSFL